MRFVPQSGTPPRPVAYRETVPLPKASLDDTSAPDAARPPVRQGVRLAIDVGSARIGVARCDPRGFLASPLTTVARGRGDLAQLAELAAGHGAIEVIVGLPTTLAGHEGKAAAGARAFAGKLARRLAPVPVRLVDERFTTVTAHDALAASGHDSRARRSVVDQAAAAVLLQAALDSERATGRPAGQPVTPDTGTTG
jgi:putative holliday junction resolvase